MIFPVEKAEASTQATQTHFIIANAGEYGSMTVDVIAAGQACHQGYVRLHGLGNSVCSWIVAMGDIVCGKA